MGSRWVELVETSSVTTNASGAKTATALYKAFGETRYTLGNLSTDYKFTGQREEASLGIYFFNARWYDGSLGRFLSPDSIVSTSTQGTQAWDRYAFVNNNPVRYTDPTGHGVDCGVGGSDPCPEDPPQKTYCEDPQASNYGAEGSCSYSTGASTTNNSPTTNPTSSYQDPEYSDWYSGQYSGCFMCHTAVANEQIIATNDQLAIAYENATTAQAIGYTPMVATAAPLLALSGAETVGISVFANAGANWHLGLELPGKMNIIHIGNSTRYGLHIAFGAVASKVADLHVYLQSAFPFFRIWRP